MNDDTRLGFSLPAVHRKKITAAFDGGTISSDGGVLLLAAAEKRLGLIDHLSALIPDHRDPSRITHGLDDILRARVFAIACGYPDADDLDDLCHDPAFKLACNRLPTAVTIWPRNRPCHAGRTQRTYAHCCAWATA